MSALRILENFEDANRLCQSKFKGSELISLYVFEFARRQGAINRPKGYISDELIAPYDEELGDAKYLRRGDKVEIDGENESVMQSVVFDWNKNQYSPISIGYRSNNMTFRCMRKGE